MYKFAISKRDNRNYLTIQKQAWIEIGIKAGWIKESQKVKESENPMPFEVLEEHKNRFGRYIIMGVNPENRTIEIEYIDGEKNGQTQVIDADFANKIEKTILREEAQKNNPNHQAPTGPRAWTPPPFMATLNSPNQYYSMGYLAAHGTLIAECSSNVIKSFEDNYFDETREQPASQYTKEYQNKMGLELRMFFPFPQQADHFALPGKIHTSRSGNSVINSNPLLWSYISLGFRLGTNEGNIQNIRNSIPPEFQGDFDAGVAGH